jgi:hypothetical protein
MFSDGFLQRINARCSAAGNPAIVSNGAAGLSESRPATRWQA